MNIAVEEAMRFTHEIGFWRILCAMWCGVLFIACVKKQEEMKAFSVVRYLILAMGLWNLARGLDCLSPYADLMPLFDSLLYVGNGFSAATLFLFCYIYISPRNKIKKIILICLFSIPIVTTLLVLTYPLHDFFIRYDHAVVLYTPVRTLQYSYGPWFLVHAVSSYIFIAASLVLLGTKLFQEKYRHRKQIIPMFVSIVLFAGWNIVTTIIKYPGQYEMISIFTHFFCVNCFFWSLYADKEEALIYRAQRNLIDIASLGVIVLNKSREIVYINTYAQMQLKLDGINNFEYKPFSDLLSSFSRLDISLTQSQGYFLRHSSTSVFYHIQENYIYAGSGKNAIGVLVSFSNISDIQTVIQELQEKAFFDIMCGCYNRTFFDIRKKDFIGRKGYPFSLLVCDIDLLKTVNDSFGHAEGNEYIVLCVNILKKSVRDDDLIFRIGGDEFSVLLPNSTSETVSRIMQKIEMCCIEANESPVNGKPYLIGLSVGGATCSGGDEIHFDDLFREADKNMYAQKKLRKLNKTSFLL